MSILDEFMLTPENLAILISDAPAGGIKRFAAMYGAVIVAEHRIALPLECSAELALRLSPLD